MGLASFIAKLNSREAGKKSEQNQTGTHKKPLGSGKVPELFLELTEKVEQKKKNSDQ